MEQSILKEILENTKVSKILDLKGKELNEENILAIANTIPKIPRLIAIDLAGVNLSEDSIKPQVTQSLFKSLKDCQDLLHVSLSLCKIENQGASFLLNEIKLHPTLLSLELDENSLSHQGINSLVELLKTNNKLISINLYGNYLGNNGGWDEITKAMKENHTLLSLSTVETGISSKFENKINNKLEENVESFEDAFFKKGKFNASIPTILVDYLEEQVPDFARRPLKLEFSPLVFIGKWQAEQRKHQASINIEEQPTILVQYTEIQNKIEKEVSTKNKENLSQNILTRIETSYN